MRGKFFFLIFLLLLPMALQAEGQDNPKETRQPTVKTTSYSPNENDVKSFVYRWFAWLDHQVADFLLLYHISNDDLLMKFPEATLRSHADFQKWYAGVKADIQSNTHELTNIKVTLLGNNRYRVELDLRWLARTYKGKLIDARFKQQWLLSLADSGRLTIKRYIVKQLNNQAK